MIQGLSFLKYYRRSIGQLRAVHLRPGVQDDAAREARKAADPQVEYGGENGYGHDAQQEGRAGAAFLLGVSTVRGSSICSIRFQIFALGFRAAPPYGSNRKCLIAAKITSAHAAKICVLVCQVSSTLIFSCQHHRRSGEYLSCRRLPLPIVLQEEGISPIAQKESTQLLFDRTSRRDAGGGKGVGGSGVSNVLLSPIKLAASARRRSRQGTTNANEDKTLSAADTERRETTKVIGCANAGAGNGCGVIGDGDVSDGNTRDAVVGNRSQARLRNDIGNKLFRRGNRTKYQKKKHASSNKRSKHWQFKSTKKVLPSEGYADAGESMADALVHSD